MKATRIFKAGGKEIDSITTLENDDNLYISEVIMILKKNSLLITKSCLTFFDAHAVHHLIGREL